MSKSKEQFHEMREREQQEGKFKSHIHEDALLQYIDWQIETSLKRKSLSGNDYEEIAFYNGEINAFKMIKGTILFLKDAPQDQNHDPTT